MKPSDRDAKGSPRDAPALAGNPHMQHGANGPGLADFLPSAIYGESIAKAGPSPVTASRAEASVAGYQPPIEKTQNL